MSTYIYFQILVSIIKFILSMLNHYIIRNAHHLKTATLSHKWTPTVSSRLLHDAQDPDNNSASPTFLSHQPHASDSQSYIHISLSRMIRLSHLMLLITTLPSPSTLLFPSTLHLLFQVYINYLGLSFPLRHHLFRPPHQTTHDSVYHFLNPITSCSVMPPRTSK